MSRVLSLFRPGRADALAPLAAGARRLVVVSHTHWDREWYLPFEDFRARLVGVVDGVLDLLDRDERFRHFTLDGQTVVLDDYLEARPERRSDVERLVRAGRLLIGPWFVMPDEFLVSGESLVRNLMMGLRTAAAFGEPMLVGYLPDTFGHVGQLPQILRGFGIDSAVVWRGVDGGARDAFYWESPDGSSVFTHYLRQGYSNAEHLPSGATELEARLAHLLTGLTPGALDGSLLLMNGGDHVAAQPDLPDLLLAAERRLGVEVVHSTLPLFLAEAKADAARMELTLGKVSGELRSSRHAPLLAGVLSTRIWLKQRNAAAQTLLEKWAEPFAVFSGHGERARPLLRLAWRHLLLNHPHDSICGCGIDVVHEEMLGRFDRAEQIGRKLVDESLATIVDQIDTASLDRNRRRERVHGHVVAFNPSSRERSDFVSFDLSLADLPSDAALLAVDSDGQAAPCQVIALREGEPFTVMAPRERVEPLLRLAGNGESWRLAVIDRAIATFAGNQLGRLAVRAGRVSTDLARGLIEVEVESGGRADHDSSVVRRVVRDLREALRQPAVRDVRFILRRGQRATLGFVARELPPLGYRAYRIVEAPSARKTSDGPDEASGVAERVASLAIENEHYRVTVDPTTGALCALDKATGSLYDDLDRLVDGGETGDEYTHCPPAIDRAIDAPSRPPTVQLVESGPVRWTLRIERVYSLPAEIGPDRRQRSAESVECRFATLVRLHDGVRRIDVETAFENAARDHLLVARFRTGVRADRTRSAGTFSVESRPIVEPERSEDWVEEPTVTVPQSGFIHVGDGRRGFAILAPGLPEVAPRLGEDGVTLDLTLLRSVGWLSRDDLATRRGAAGPALPTLGAQGLGQQTFRYSVVPGALEWESAAAEAESFAAPPRAVVAGSHRGALPTARGFLCVEPSELVVSAVKPAEDGGGIIVRVFNPTEKLLDAVVGFAGRVAQADETNLDESVIGPLALEGERVRFPLRPGGILTARVVLGPA